MRDELSTSRRPRILTSWPLFATIVFITAIVPFGLLTWYAHPFSDDYWFLHHVGTDGPLAVAAGLYMEWTGRYTSNFLLAFLYDLLVRAGDHSITLYRIVPVALLAALFGSAWYAVKTWAGTLLTRSERAFIVTLFTAVLLSGLPSTAEGIYWLPAAVTYTGSAALILLFLGAARPLFRDASSPPVRMKRIAGLAALIALINGMNETAVVVTAFVLTSACLTALIRRRSVAPSAALLIWTVLSIGVVILAPGNAVRLMYEQPGLPLFSGAAAALHEAARRLVSVPLSTITIGMVAATPLFAKIAERAGAAVTRPRHLLLAGTGLWLLLSAALFSVLWGYGAIPARVDNFVFFLTVLGSAALWFLIVRAVVHAGAGRSRTRASAAQPVLIRSMVLASLVVMAATTNVRVAWSDLLSGDAAGYRNEWEERHDRVAEARRRGEERIEVAPLKSRPRTIFFHDLLTDPYEWPNAYYAKHAGIGAIRVEDGKPWPEAPPPADGPGHPWND